MSKKRSDIVGNLPQGLVFVISAPAGTGKSTLTQMVCKELAPHVVQSISCTTRKPRKKEVPGRDYHFLTEQDFEIKLAKEEFLECAEVFGHRYGTLKRDVEKLTKAGRHVILVIDTQGAMKLKEVMSAVFIFIAPPTLEELEKRLRKRKTETEAVITKRLEWAQTEIERAEFYDYFIINEELETAYQVLKSIIIAEEHKNRDLQ